jgi:hypothetical protein
VLLLDVTGSATSIVGGSACFGISMPSIPSCGFGIHFSIVPPPDVLTLAKINSGEYVGVCIDIPSIPS